MTDWEQEMLDNERADLERRITAQADTYPTPHDRLSAFIEGTFLEPEERDKLRAALEALSADTEPGGCHPACRMCSGAHDPRCVLDDGHQEMCHDAFGHALTYLVAVEPDYYARLRAALAAPSRDAGLDVERLAAALMEADTPGWRGDKKHERAHLEHAARIAAEYGE